jgi:hypothetical protein
MRPANACRSLRHNGTVNGDDMKRRMQTVLKTSQAGWHLLLRLLKTSVMIGSVLLLCNGLSFQTLAIAANLRSESIAEVSPPIAIQQLRAKDTAPKIKILSPKADETVSETTVTARLQVENFRPFKDANLGLGPYLNVSVDDLPSQFIYDANTPVELKDLKPGTHVLRVFANHPWGESYKNSEAYAQVSFNVLTASTGNTWDQQQPLLTYNQPTGSYGAEPILLDYYLSTSKPHTSDDSLLKDNLQVRVTINGQSFKTDRWLPLYLSGFHSGTNWIRLELLDRQEQPLKGPFTEVTQAFQFQPRGRDGLARLVQDQLSAEELQQIVDLVASQKAAKGRERIVPPVIVTPVPEAAPIPLPKSEISNQPQPARIVPRVSTPSPAPSPSPTPALSKPEQPGSITNEPLQPKPEASPSKAMNPKPAQAPPKKIWERFKQVLPEPAKPEISQKQPVLKKIESPTPRLSTPPVLSTPLPTPTPSPFSVPETPSQPPTQALPSKSIKEVQPLQQRNKKIETAEQPRQEPAVSLQEAQQKAKDLWAQFRRSLPKVSVPENTKPSATPPKSPEPLISKSITGPESRLGKSSKEFGQSLSEAKPPILPTPITESETSVVDKTTQNTPLPDFLKRFQSAKQQVQQTQPSSIELTP